MTIARLSEILIVEDDEDRLALTMEALEGSDRAPDIDRAWQRAANGYLVQPIAFRQLHHKARERGPCWGVLDECDKPVVGD
jgi:hypothetical protein